MATLAPYEPVDPLLFDLPSLAAQFGERFGKGKYHALAHTALYMCAVVA